MTGLNSGKVAVTLASAVIVLISSLASGQSKTTQTSVKQLQDAKLLQMLSTPSSATVALEGAVDPAKYILGPGDRLEIAIWGAFEDRRDVMVAADGQIAIPNIGNVPVAGLTIQSADSLVRSASRKAYPRAEITLRLVNVRSMKAVISGAVQLPGAYEVSAVSRLSDLIGKAGGLLLPDVEEQHAQSDQNTANMTPAEQRRANEEAKAKREARPQASLRHITIVSKDGTSRQVDLQKFFTTGDPEFNPVLRDGDAVHIPLVSREIGVLNIFGAVKSPGEYEFSSGDRVRTLVDLAGGFRENAIVSDIAIVRFDAAGAKQTEILCDLTDQAAIGPELHVDDRVFIRQKPDFRRKYNVSVKGEVRFPGSYSIEHDKTRLTEIIAACGGLTDRANLYNARVVRRAMAETEDPEYERLKSVPFAEMTEMEYEYFKIRSREEAPPVVVNFQKLFGAGDETLDIVLQDKDEIEIPTVSPTVKVAGQVNNPGLIRYVAGEDYLYYIEKAGGYSWNARKGMLRLIKARSGTWMKPKKSTPIEIGDTIFVPEKQEVDWWELSKDLLLVASQVATVLIMVRSL